MIKCVHICIIQYEKLGTETTENGYSHIPKSVTELKI
jgi:hypothetical protein